MSQRHQIFIVARISPRKSPSRVPPTANSPAQPQHGDDHAAAGASQQHLGSATKPPQTTKFPISNNPEYRCVFALHHQWHFGMTALGACYRLITSIRENAPAVAAELGTLDPVSWKNYGSNVWDQKRAATEETICPIIATLVSAVASWNPESGYLSQSTRFHPPWVHYCRSDNNDGFTVLDITDPFAPAYCFLWMGENGDEVLSAKQYANLYSGIPEPTTMLHLENVPVMTEATIWEIWPSRHTRIRGSFLSGETGLRDADVGENQGGVQSLRDLSVKRLVSSSFEQDDNCWLDCRDLDIFPDLPPAILSHIITQGEQRVNVMEKSSSAIKLLSFAFNALHKHERIDDLNMSILPFSTMTAQHIASVFKSFFTSSWDGPAQRYTIKDLNLSANPNLTCACVQHILSAIPNYIVIEKLIIVNLSTFQPRGLLLPPRSLLSPTTTPSCPDILTVQSSALSALALPPLDISAHTGDFMPIIPHPFGPASPNSVSSTVICFPIPSSHSGFEGHAVPIHVPFNFAHPRTAAANLIEFIWCLANTGTGDFHEYPEVVVKIFTACNPVNILQVWGLGKLRTYDYYHRFNEWSEKRRTEKKAILSSVLESAEATGSWTVFVSAVPSLHNVNAADVKIRYGFVRVDGEGKLVIASIPELIATCVKPGPEGRPCGMEDLRLSREARWVWETQISQGFVEGSFGKLQVRLFAEEEIWGSG